MSKTEVSYAGIFFRISKLFNQICSDDLCCIFRRENRSSFKKKEERGSEIAAVFEEKREKVISDGFFPCVIEP
jgi:hypothetical protein